MSVDAESLERKKSHMERPLHFFQSPIEVCEVEGSPVHTPQELEANGMKGSPATIGLPQHIKEGHGGPHIAFHHHAEATPSELFYDLFFVANLATFTRQNEVNSGAGLGNYIGFFCVIWFTWFQVSLYDVRFSRDSVFDRLCKVAQFGVMIGFSFIAYYFDPAGADAGTGYVDGKSLSLILMASRLIISLQYLATLIWLRKYPGTMLPLTLMIATYLTSSVIYVGVSFDFVSGSEMGSHAYAAWYVTTVVESIITLSISCIWRFSSFKGTHLVERMSLMTLIVLGEGILGLSSACVTVWGTTNFYTGLGATVASALLLIYGVYQLYFDTLAEEHFGTLRQQLWAILHFPLHLSLVLFDEGVKQFVVWNTAIKQVTDFTNAVSNVAIFQQVVLDNSYEFSTNNNTGFFSAQAEALQNTFLNFTSEDLALYNGANLTQLGEYRETIANGTILGSENVVEAVYGFWLTVLKGITSPLAIEGAKSNDNVPMAEIDTLFEEAGAVFSLFDLVFAYFYAATGIALLLILALWLISQRKKNAAFDYIRYVWWALVGITICMLAVLDVSAQQNANPGSPFVNGNWVLPTPMILILSLVILFHLPFGANRTKRHSRPTTHSMI